MSSDDQGPRAYSIPEVCRRTGLGRTTIYAALKSGELRGRKHRRRTLVLAEDLQTWLTNLDAVGCSSSKSQR